MNPRDRLAVFIGSTALILAFTVAWIGALGGFR